MDYITSSSLIKDILNTIPQPWGPDLLDQVFLAIENNPEWMEAYERMCEAHGCDMVENSIGFNVMGLSGMKSLDRVKPARSRLIQNYTELGPDTPA